MNEWIDEWMKAWMDEWTNGICLDGRMCEWTDEWTDGLMDGMVSGWDWIYQYGEWEILKKKKKSAHSQFSQMIFLDLCSWWLINPSQFGIDHS